jgi:hypothetical protein
MVHVETQALSYVHSKDIACQTAADKKNKIIQQNLINIINDLNLKESEGPI